MSRHKRATDVPAPHIYEVQFRPYPAAPWGSPFPFADAPTFSTAEEAQAEATCGDNGETRVLRYRLESVGPVVTLPVCADPDCPDADAHPVECQLCSRPVPAGSTYPLCPSCAAAAREGGRQAAEAGRHAREVGHG